VVEIICQPAYFWDCNSSLRIVYCESRFDPWAIGGDNFGWWQISESTWRSFFGPERWALVLDPIENTSMAYQIWLRAGGTFTPWACRA
jgi:hypothetical protein